MTEWYYISYSAYNQDNSENAVDTATEIESQTETQIDGGCFSADARAQETIDNSVPGESVPSKAVTFNDLWSQEKEETFLSSSFTAESSDFHFYFKCRNCRCKSLSIAELNRLKAKSGDKFHYHWVSDESLNFCKKTGINCLICLEGDGMFYLLCRKHNYFNSQNKSEKNQS